MYTNSHHTYIRYTEYVLKHNYMYVYFYIKPNYTYSPYAMGYTKAITGRFIT